MMTLQCRRSIAQRLEAASRDRKRGEDNFPGYVHTIPQSEIEDPQCTGVPPKSVDRHRLCEQRLYGVCLCHPTSLLLESQQVGLVDDRRSVRGEGARRKEECEEVIGAVGVEVGGELRERLG